MICENCKQGKHGHPINMNAERGACMLSICECCGTCDGPSGFRCAWCSWPHFDGHSKECPANYPSKSPRRMAWTEGNRIGCKGELKEHAPKKWTDQNLDIVYMMGWLRGWEHIGHYRAEGIDAHY